MVRTIAVTSYFGDAFAATKSSLSFENFNNVKSEWKLARVHIFGADCFEVWGMR